MAPPVPLLAARTECLGGSAIDSITSLLHRQRHDIVRFAMGSPAAEAVPSAVLAGIAAEALGPDAYGYAATEGDLPLRDALQVLRVTGEETTADTQSGACADLWMSRCSASIANPTETWQSCRRTPIRMHRGLGGICVPAGGALRARIRDPRISGGACPLPPAHIRQRAGVACYRRSPATRELVAGLGRMVRTRSRSRRTALAAASSRPGNELEASAGVNPGRSRRDTARRERQAPRVSEANRSRSFIVALLVGFWALASYR